MKSGQAYTVQLLITQRKSLAENQPRNIHNTRTGHHIPSQGVARISTAHTNAHTPPPTHRTHSRNTRSTCGERHTTPAYATQGFEWTQE